MLAQGRDAASPRDAADRERGFERSLRRDALRKRVMMKMVPTPDQVRRAGARGGGNAHAPPALRSRDSRPTVPLSPLPPLPPTPPP